MINERLRAERERLGLTQEVFATAAGVKRRTLIDWEKGISSPTVVQLAVLAGIGLDALYVLTGQRMTEMLSPDEAELIERYRSSPQNLKEASRLILSTGAVSGSTSNVKIKKAKNSRIAGRDYYDAENQGDNNEDES